MRVCARNGRFTRRESLMASSRLVMLAGMLTVSLAGTETRSLREPDAQAAIVPTDAAASSTGSDQAHNIIVRFDPSPTDGALAPATSAALADLQAEVVESLCDGRISVVRLGANINVR